MEARRYRPEGSSRGLTYRAETTKGIWTDHIAGRFRKITVHQLAMAWWAFSEGHISYKQLRIYFAAHEMAERRRYTHTDRNSPDGKRRPTYGPDEIKALVGGRGSKTADASLRADIRQLARLGLVTIQEHDITFAVSIENLRVDEIASFWTMFGALRHKARSVPVPRRVLRAMAGGFTRGMTGVALATMIRSLFWHKSQDAYRVDGRTKREWITQVFGISERSVTEARGRLIDIGWLVPLEAPQYLLNKFGTYDKINTEWAPAKPQEETSTGNGSSGGVGEQLPTREAFRAASMRGESASQNRFFGSESASPDLNRSLQLTLNQNTRKLRPTRAGPAAGNREENTGQTERRAGGHAKPANIRDVRLADLNDMDRLMTLHRQAVTLGLSNSSHAGILEFVCFAERARCRGTKAGALFFWLIKNRKTEFITLSDEDEASRRLKEHLHGSPRDGLSWHQPEKPVVRPEPAPFTEQENFVAACLRVAKQRGIVDAYIVARQGREWTRDQWDEAHHAFNVAQRERWARREDEGVQS